jgi:hypothetical protein
MDMTPAESDEGPLWWKIPDLVRPGNNDQRGQIGFLRRVRRKTTVPEGHFTAVANGPEMSPQHPQTRGTGPRSVSELFWVGPLKGRARNVGVVHNRVTVHKPDAQAKDTAISKNTSCNKRMRKWL